jgi:hypothetical protein
MPTIKRLGVAYDWGQVTVTLFGRQLVGIQGIEYDMKREVKENYGAGYQPVSRGYGNKQYSCKLVGVDVKEVRAILKAAGTVVDITDIPAFPITVTIGDDVTNATIVDVIHDCVFKGDGFKSNQNDSEAKMDYELSVMDITFGS